MRISDWSSDVRSSDLHLLSEHLRPTLPIGSAACGKHGLALGLHLLYAAPTGDRCGRGETGRRARFRFWYRKMWGFKSLRPHQDRRQASALAESTKFQLRSEEHTSELQSLMRISYAVFCLQQKKYQY